MSRSLNLSPEVKKHEEDKLRHRIFDDFTRTVKEVMPKTISRDKHLFQFLSRFLEEKAFRTENEMKILKSKSQLSTLFAAVIKVLLSHNSIKRGSRELIRLQGYKNQLDNLGYYRDEMKIYEPVSVKLLGDILQSGKEYNSGEKAFSEDSPLYEKLLQRKTLAIVYLDGLNGGGINPVGHAALFLGPGIGYVQIRRGRGEPQFMTEEQFCYYMEENKKEIVAVQQVKIPNMKGVADKLVELATKPWVWLGLKNNCFSFCKDVVKAGDNLVPELGGYYRAPNKTGGPPIPFQRLRNVKQAHVHVELFRTAKPIISREKQLKGLRDDLNRLDELSGKLQRNKKFNREGKHGRSFANRENMFEALMTMTPKAPSNAKP